MNAWSVATADDPAAAAPLATTAAGSSPRMLELIRATTWSKSRPYVAFQHVHARQTRPDIARGAKHAHIGARRVSGDDPGALRM